MIILRIESTPAASMETTTQHFKVSKGLHQFRLDMALVKLCPNLSRRKIRSAIDTGGVYVNKKRVRISSRTVSTGDEVSLQLLAATPVRRDERFELRETDIIHEDQDCLIINKPAGLASQATKDPSCSHAESLVKKLVRSRSGEAPEIVLVHRLDQETSGLLMFAKGAENATWLTQCFREKTIKKTYDAICYGIPREQSFEVKNFLSAIQPPQGMVRSVRSGGKFAHTLFRVLHSNRELGISHVECSPQTGRSHQIRIHLSEFGHPLVGDKKYGRSFHLRDFGARRHFLHARSLIFKPRPDREAVEVTCPLPDDMAQLIKTL